MAGVFGEDSAVDDLPQCRPGVTLLQHPVMFLLLVGVSGIVMNGTCRPFCIMDIVKGRTSCFSGSGNQGSWMAVEKPAVYVDLM